MSYQAFTLTLDLYAWLSYEAYGAHQKRQAVLVAWEKPIRC